MRDLIGSIHTTPNAAIAAIRDHLGERLAVGVRPDDLVGALVIGPLETRIIGTRPDPGAWVAEVERWAALVRDAPWDALRLVVAYMEGDVLVVVVGHPEGEMQTWSAPRHGPWSVRRGDELDLVPVLTV